MSDASNISFLKKIVKKTKSSKKWEQLFASAIIIPYSFVVPNKVLNKISVVLFGMSLPVLETKQPSPIVSFVFENWTDQMKTKSFSPLVSGAATGGVLKTITNYQRFAGWVAFTLVPDAIFKIKLAYIKTVFHLIHGFLDAKSVLKDNIKLSLYLTTLKIAKSLVVSESGFFSAIVVLCDMPLNVSATNIKTALSVFGNVTCVVLKSAGIWQYMVVYFKKLDSAVSALNH
ncbi:hypothetical protein G9A89_007795 [Geosiphon pyriformis]|nr:hypothetical protein G9A89_007795 [Geosiphon pyriformis]